MSISPGFPSRVPLSFERELSVLDRDNFCNTINFFCALRVSSPPLSTLFVSLFVSSLAS